MNGRDGSQFPHTVCEPATKNIPNDHASLMTIGILAPACQQLFILMPIYRGL